MNPINISDYPSKNKPLWWQIAGLQETATGYGRKLRTVRMIQYAGRWRRVYCMCFSNAGTCYIVVNGRPVVVMD